MAAFACFSNIEEATTYSYRALIQRLRREAQEEKRLLTISAASFLNYSTQKDRPRLGIKDFIYCAAMKMYDETSILTCDNPLPILKNFVLLIEKQELHDDVRSTVYYGEIKKVIYGFMNYFTYVIDDVLKKVDKYSYDINKEMLLTLIDNTIQIYTENHETFLQEYQPLKSEEDKIKYQEVEDRHKKFLDELGQVRDTWVAKVGFLEPFAMECLEKSIKKISYICNFAHTFLSKMLADRLYEISVSVRDNANRLYTNMRKYNELCTEATHELFQNLYEKNKEHLEIYRRVSKRSTDAADVSRTIELLRNKIENTGNEETMARLEIESRYWNGRLKEFNDLASALNKIRIELDRLEADKQTYENTRILELPGTKTFCFDLIGENINERILYLQQKQMDTTRALLTYFCVRGTDQIFYNDCMGSFYCDEFNHQNYTSDYGMKFYHVKCNGEFVENSDTEPYYFDQYGRFILRDGEMIHQVGPCTSEYKLGENGLFIKVTKDCGHSEKFNPECRLQFKDPITDKVILPKAAPIDITGTLDAETVKYLWDSFGSILPEVLYEVATKQPKNPIHYMAHILLKRRLEATASDFRLLRQKADDYRTKKYDERNAKIMKETQARMSREVKRRKPEEFDITPEWAVYTQQTADRLNVNLMEYYND